VRKEAIKFNLLTQRFCWCLAGAQKNIVGNHVQSHLRFTLDVGDLRGSMRPGQRAVISVDAYGREYKGKVDSLAGATGARFSLLPPENATGNYVKVVQRVPVKIVVDNWPPDVPVGPGMSVVPWTRVR